MSRDTILTDSDGVGHSYDNIKTQGWLDGHVGGLDAAVHYLKEEAAALFRDGRDKEAMALRGIAEKMQAALTPEMKRRAEGLCLTTPDSPLNVRQERRI